MAFKMKYSPNKKTGMGFPYKNSPMNLVDDIDTQNKIMGDIKTAVSEGKSDSEIADIVNSQTDFATTYVYNPKTGATKTTETKSKEGTTNKGNFDIKHMDNVYKVDDGEFEYVDGSSEATVSQNKSRLNRDNERSVTAFEGDGRSGKSKHVTHTDKDLSKSDLAKLKRTEGFHEF